MDFLLRSIVLAAVATVVLMMWIIGTLFRRVGPNRALIVYGWGGTHIVTGGGKVVWPLFQSFQELSLELMSFDVAPEQQLYTSQGVAVAVEAVAQIKVKSDPESIRTAAEQFLTKPPAEREALLRLVMEGHLRGIVGLLKVEEIVKEPEIVAGRVRDSVSDDLNKMGLEVVSFTIKKVIDENDYINNMGRPGHRADQARGRHRPGRGRARHRHQARHGHARGGRRPGGGRPGAGDRPDRVGDQASRGHARPGGQAGRVRRVGPRSSAPSPRRPTTSRPTRPSRRSSPSRCASSRSSARSRSTSRSWRSSAARSSSRRR